MERGVELMELNRAAFERNTQARAPMPWFGASTTWAKNRGLSAKRSSSWSTTCRRPAPAW